MSIGVYGCEHEQMFGLTCESCGYELCARSDCSVKCYCGSSRRCMGCVAAHEANEDRYSVRVIEPCTESIKFYCEKSSCEMEYDSSDEGEEYEEDDEDDEDDEDEEDETFWMDI